MESITVNSKSEENNELKFVLSGVDISIANAIRRTILSDIPIVAFKAFGGESSDAVFTVNTSRLNNEILSQRLSCIPIHILPDSEEYNIVDLLLELDEENTTDEMRILTTADFKVRVISTGLLLSRQMCREIFKPFISMSGEEYFIQFARLRQRISDEIPGEKISMTCKFSVATASENSMFNVVGTCAYGMTVDEAAAEQALTIKQQKWHSAGMSEELIASETLNWELLDKKRIILRNSFDFIVGSVGPIPNTDIITTSCLILINRCKRIIDSIRGGLMVATTDNIVSDNSIEYILENEDYTIGNVLSDLLYKTYYEKEKTILFCGFKKMHPHDTDGIIRIMFAYDGEDGLSNSSKSKSNDKVKGPVKGPVNARVKDSDDESSLGSPPPLESPDISTVEQPQYVPQSPTFAPPSSDESPPLAPSSPPTQFGSPADVPRAKSQSGGAVNPVSRELGFKYIVKCCNDAIEIFEIITRLFNKK
jgi:DNA-directed RNA polymerase subunit L